LFIQFLFIDLDNKQEPRIMQLFINKKSLSVTDFKQASTVYSELRDKSGKGASSFKPGLIKNDKGDTTHYISYNGKVWVGSDPNSMDKRVLAFNPYEN